MSTDVYYFLFCIHSQLKHVLLQTHIFSCLKKVRFHQHNYEFPWPELLMMLMMFECLTTRSSKSRPSLLKTGKEILILSFFPIWLLTGNLSLHERLKTWKTFWKHLSWMDRMSLAFHQNKKSKLPDSSLLIGGLLNRGHNMKRSCMPCSGWPPDVSALLNTLAMLKFVVCILVAGWEFLKSFYTDGFNTSAWSARWSNIIKNEKPSYTTS